MTDHHSDDSDGAVPPGIGDRIRAMRQSRDLSIRALATRAGVSTGLISQVERGINDPSLQTARAIAKALNTPLFDLFQDPDRSEIAVVRADRRMSLASPHGGITYQRISPGSGSLEMLEGRLTPHSASSDEPWSHASEECVVVLDGALAVEVDGTVHHPAEGDSGHFNSRYPHRYLNEADEPVRFMLSITPPSY